MRAAATWRALHVLSCARRAPTRNAAVDFGCRTAPAPGVHLGLVVLAARNPSCWPWWSSLALLVSCCCSSFWGLFPVSPFLHLPSSLVAPPPSFHLWARSFLAAVAEYINSLLLSFGNRRAQPPKETPGAPQLPLHASSTLSLPRVRPPWTLEEAEMRRGDRLSLWGPDVGQRPANAPRLKTFLGSSSSPPSPPQPPGGCHNLVFVSDAEEKDRRSYF
nr:uncharacterized protein LOC118092321 isoform X1 [Zootoca vivipara]